MGPITSLLLLLTSLLAASCAVICVAVCYRLRSEFFLMAKASKQWAASVASFDSRMKTLEERYGSVAKREALAARRDPVTGKSTRVGPESKDDLRKRLGLVGSNAARVAHQIHSTGGIKQ